MAREREARNVSHNGPYIAISGAIPLTGNQNLLDSIRNADTTTYGKAVLATGSTFVLTCEL
jgi:hypothetical protein